MTDIHPMPSVWRPASFWRRVGAQLIDALLCAAGLGLWGYVFGRAWDATFRDPGYGPLLLFASLIVFPWLYSAGYESSEHMATPGKRALGIVVTGSDGGRIGFWRASGRCFGKYISAAILMIGFLMAAFSKTHRALHDHIAATQVIYRK